MVQISREINGDSHCCGEYGVEGVTSPLKGSQNAHVNLVHNSCLVACQRDGGE